MKTFVVKRTRWLRGRMSVLRDDRGRQCCLGFVGRQCGVKAKDLLHVLLPRDLADKNFINYPQLTRGMGWDDFSDINDSEELSGKDREEQLKALALKAGFRFKFVD